jgi:hypothetical protein
MKWDDDIDLKSLMRKSNEELVEEVKRVKSAQAGSDKRVQELMTKNKDINEELRRFKAIGDSSGDILKRVDRIEKAYKEKEQQLETRYYARERALVAGVDWELIADFPFDSREAVDAKVSALTRFATDAAQREVSSMMIASTKPKAGAEVSYHRTATAAHNAMEAAYGNMVEKELAGLSR